MAQGNIRQCTQTEVHSAKNHALIHSLSCWVQASMEGASPGPAFGALIFTCNGRGRNLFGEPHYDSRKIAEFIPVPSSGFLCNGVLPALICVLYRHSCFLDLRIVHFEIHHHWMLPACTCIGCNAALNVKSCSIGPVHMCSTLLGLGPTLNCVQTMLRSSA